MSSLLSIDDLGREDVERLLEAARSTTSWAGRQAGRVVALVFLSDSLRTRVGFEIAAARLGATTTSVLATRHTAVMSQAESLEDTVRSIAGWCDAVLVRTPVAGAVAELARVIEIPLVNCGDGDREHPTQALCDLRAIAEHPGDIDGRRIVMVGDLRGMRAAHSLALGLSLFDEVRLRCVSPPGLELPEELVSRIRARGVEVESVHELEVGDAEVLYVAGLPLHTAVGELRGAAREPYLVTAAVASRLPADARIFCPLPRIDEIAREVDQLPQAAYFAAQDAALSVRCAVLNAILGGHA